MKLLYSSSFFLWVKRGVSIEFMISRKLIAKTVLDLQDVSKPRPVGPFPLVARRL